MRRFTILILFIIVSLTWGTTWLAMRLTVETISPIFATGIRFIFAAPLLVIIARITNTPLLFPRGQRTFQIFICLFYFSIPFTLMIYGEKFVSSGLAAIIFANMPVAVLIASIFFLKEKTNIYQIIGLTIALAALAGILLNESSAQNGTHWQGVIALVAAVAIHAIIYTLCKKRSCSVSVITFNALPCLCAGIILTMAGWCIETPQLTTFSLQSWLSAAYLGAFAGVFGILCYFFLQQQASAFQASLVFLIFPVIAVSLESYVYGYAISFYSMLLILPLGLGIFITLASRNIKLSKSRAAVTQN